jgi:hypothetical protein
MERPSGKEIYNKIRKAKEAVLEDSIVVVDPVVIAEDAIELGYQAKDLTKVLSDILEEIAPNHYAGSRPPKKSYKSDILNLELFAFRWVSKFFGCESYLKFCIKQDSIYLVSLHQHRGK